MAESKKLKKVERTTHDAENPAKIAFESAHEKNFDKKASKKADDKKKG